MPKMPGLPKVPKVIAATEHRFLLGIFEFVALLAFKGTSRWK
jgi:hypothetical protein